MVARSSGWSRFFRYKRAVSAVERLWAPWRLEYIGAADEDDGASSATPDEEPLVHRGELAFVLLNRFPYSSGHLMVAPARHAATSPR